MLKKTKKITSVVLSVTTIGWLSGASALVPLVAMADHTTAHTIEQLQAQIAALQAQLNALSGSSGGSSAGKCDFTRSLTLGSRGDDVKCLQDYLTSTGHFTFSGGSTSYFGNVTKTAVAAWQAANGVAPAAGYFGPISQAKYGAMVAVATPPAPPAPPTPGGTPAPVPAPSGTLKVEAGMHPSASLFPVNATRVPFTVVKLTAPADSDVTVKSIVVERTGLASDTAFAGAVLLDEGGEQIGIARTFNSVHQATLNEAFVVKAGTTRTMTLGGNAQTSGNSLGGQIAYLSLVSVNSSLPISGTLPIAGAGHTVNETLTIGSVTLARGSTDPGTSVTKRVDTKDYTFSSIRVTAGSQEKVYLKSVRWNQTGSAGVSDLANVKTYVEGTAFDTGVTSDGKFYVATFPDKGILIDKGFSKEISIKGDVVGGTLRTADFDVAKRTDLGIIGETYGYGITAPQTGTTDPTDDSAAFSNVEDPWYDAAQVTIGQGTILVTSSSKSPAQNIAINLANQPLGAIDVTVQGEEISVSRIGWNISLGSEGTDDDVDDITNVTLTDENGNVVAGPADGTAADSSNTAGSGDGSVIMNDTVTFRVGTHTYYLKGKIGTEIDNNVTVIASSTPRNDFAGTVRGLVSGNTISVDPNSVVTLNTMTVKAGALAVSVSSVPIAQTVIAGAKEFLFSNYILDASGSGEDVKLATLAVARNAPSDNDANLINCKLFDGASSVSTTQNPTTANADTNINFTLTGGGLVIPKGVAKTLALKCDIGAGAPASGIYSWGYVASNTDLTPTGVTSGQSITETETASEGQSMTIAASGTLTATLDPSSPGYKVVGAKQTGVEISKFRFSATNEEINLKQLALVMGGVASNTPVDLVGRKVTIWEGAQQIGDAIFPTTDYATTSALAYPDGSAVKIAKGGSKTITIKGDIADVSIDGPLTVSGDLLLVDYDNLNVGINGNYGSGVASGQNISASGNPDAPAGKRIMKAYPKLANVPLTSAEKVLPSGTTANKIMYRFSVEAVNGDVALYKWSFTIGSSTLAATPSVWSLYSYSDAAFSSADTSFGVATGLLNGGQCYLGGASPSGAGTREVWIYPNTSSTCNAATSTYMVSAGVKKYFELRATVSSVESGTTNTDQITVQLQGDAAFPTTHQTNGGAMTGSEMGAVGTLASTGNLSELGGTGLEADANDDFLWSPVSTTTLNTFNDFDFANGFQVEGLPSNGMTQESMQSN